MEIAVDTASPIIILGANGAVGRSFMQQLAARGLAAEVLSRRHIDVPAGFSPTLIDWANPCGWKPPAGAIVISFLPLWILADILPLMKGIGKIVATGSTSIFGKANSDDPHELEIVSLLKNAEERLRMWAKGEGVIWTLLRPTLIYNSIDDNNIARIARFIRRCRFLPLASPARGLRQPIHAQDVAKAALHSLNSPATANRSLNIAGGEILSYREMTDRIFAALGCPPRYLMLPTPLLKTGFRIARCFGFFIERDFGAAIFDRMNEDLIFEAAEGMRALDYQPRPFTPGFFDTP